MKKRVFVMDDSELYIDIITGILSGKGLDVCATTDYDSVFTKIKDFYPDVIIVDYLMPAKNGIEVIEELKQIPYLAIIPVLLVSSEEVKSLKNMHCDIDDYISKSEAASEIINHIKAYANIGSTRKSIRDMKDDNRLP
ncbi:response regulator [Alteromonas phage XX1924]|nr:response regulator [Alteromonas phage XX1924]